MKNVICTITLAAATLLLSSCALFRTNYVELGSNVENTSRTFRVKMGSSGRVYVRQGYKKKYGSCAKLRRNLKVRITDTKKGKKQPVLVSCSINNGYITAYTKKFVKKGKYKVKINYRKDRPFLRKPKVYAIYKNSNFESGEDYVLGGAVPIEQGKKAEGDVFYQSGDSYDWYHVKGEEKLVSLTLMTKAARGDISASVYRLAKGAKHPKRIGRLKKGKGGQFRLRKDDLYVRVNSLPKGAKAKYSVLRKDRPIANTVRVPVIDLYHLDDASAMVLVRAVQGVAVKTELTVFGKEPSGKLVHLGNCRVSSLEQGQASCRLDEPQGNTFHEYEAKAILEG